MTSMSEDQQAIRDSVRDFVRREIAPNAAQWDRDCAIPTQALAALGELGYFGACIPPDWSGSGMDFLSYVLLSEELAYGDAGLCNTINATNSFANNVLAFGTQSQKERFMRPVVQGRHVACLLLSEPQAGSDAANLRTRAELRGDVQDFIGDLRASPTTGQMPSQQEKDALLKRAGPKSPLAVQLQASSVWPQRCLQLAVVQTPSVWSQVWPPLQVPQVPPQPSAPQVLPVHCGTQGVTFRT